MTATSAGETLAARVTAGDRGALARAITLVESTRDADVAAAEALLEALLPHTGRAVRVGISGPPGVGKSTLIDALGATLCAAGHKVAVLAVDPSSAISGGSILGDKTRMGRLAAEPRAFIRPSPSGATLGGVARRTREAMLVCEAAGFDVILVETVGVGQSETAVADMVDTFVVLHLPGAGDELQGIKKGLLELADVIAVTKADGDNAARADAARRELTSAQRYLRARSAAWGVPVLALSAVSGAGLDDLWRDITAHRAAITAAGELDARRRAQRQRWLWSMVGEQLERAFRAHPGVGALLPALEARVADGGLAPSSAARQLLAAFGTRSED